LSNTNLTKIRRWTRKLRKDKQFLLHHWHKTQNEDKKQPQNTKLKIRCIYKYKRYIMYTKELLIFPELPSSPPDFSEVRVAQAFVFCVMFCRSLFVPLSVFVWLLYCLSCKLPFWLPLWYLQTFLVGHCITCHSSYRSDYPFDIFKLWQEIQWPTRKVWRYQRGNQNGNSHDRQYNDQQEKFEDIKGVIRTVNHMT
jgi:hypothetical protein